MILGKTKGQRTKVGVKKVCVEGIPQSPVRHGFTLMVKEVKRPKAWGQDIFSTALVEIVQKVPVNMERGNKRWQILTEQILY